MNAKVSISDHVKQIASQIDFQLKSYIEEMTDVPAILKEAMYYSLAAGGKRIRPYLTLTAAYAIQGNENSEKMAMGPACAVEFIHTYSLIHDDLPAMDNDDYRRGKPTNHKVFGEAMAILAGDGLLTQSFDLITSEVKKNDLDPKIAIDIISDLVKYSGAKGMVGGQVADMQGEQGITSLEQLQYIHEHKTSDLITFSVLAGARVGGATQSQLDKLAIYAKNIGLAFQIQDDILDVIGDEKKLGKKTNSDLVQKKVTYPFLVGLEKSKLMVEELSSQAKSEVLEANLAAPQRLLEIADYLVKREF